MKNKNDTWVKNDVSVENKQIQRASERQGEHFYIE